ncbi:MAG: ABC transporter ATP-binding protein [Myxococcales bacterium]|nr:ABC transporter ATP-binding protein [Myxococcales bacterium]
MALLLRFWRQYAQRYRLWYVLGLVCLLGTTALTVAIPGFVEGAVDALDTGQPATRWAVAVLLAGVAIMVVRTLSRTFFFNPGRAVEFRMKSALFDRLLGMPRSYFDAMRPGDLINRGTNDANSMRALIGFASLQLFNVVFILVLTLGRMLHMDVVLTLACVGPLAVAAVILRYAVAKMFRLFAENMAQVSTLSARILETYGGVAVLQSYNAVPGAMARFDRENDRLLDLSEQVLKVRAWLLPIVSVTGNLCVVIVLFLGGRKVMHGDGFTVGQLAAFIVYVNILVGGITSFGWLIGAAQRGYLGLKRMYDVIDAQSDRPAGTAPMPDAAAGLSLAVQGLSFTHHGATAPALRDISFSVQPGETLGIFGLTGAGKSTLLNLLARVYDPPAGTVFLSGTDVTTLPEHAYWQAIAFVSQEPFLFSKSVRENVAVADAADAIDAERLQRAIEDAALGEDVHAFRDGLDTVVGERGITVSGGQRQRTALARAFYRDYDLLLLDDVMSAVDHATEKQLVEAIYRRAAGKPTLVVSHRLSVLARADRVIVLDDGQLVDAGTHAELLTRDGPYARTWRLQQARAEVEAADV